jgi:hypothetical protein
MMQPAERLNITMSGGAPDRAPVMAKIWVNLAARLTGADLCAAIEDPGAAMRVVADAAILTGMDGARQFLFPARRTRKEAGRLIEVDSQGRRVGEIDLEGGLATHLDRYEDFRLDDPYHVAFRTSWRHREPQRENDKPRFYERRQPGITQIVANSLEFPRLSRHRKGCRHSR